MPEGWAKDCRWQGTHLIYIAFGVVQFREGAMEAERHVCPAAEEDQGTGLARQISLVHFNMGFALGVKDNHMLSLALTFLPSLPLPPALFYTSSSPQLCHRDPRRCDVTVT